MAGGIFISYRREDSAAYARLIYDRVAAQVKRSRVFIDVHDIAPGRDFVKALSDQVGACDILVAIVGRRWCDARDANGVRRLDDPRDFVRIEIEAALQRDIRVIPVLVDGAAMPNAADLPEALRSFCNRQALEISHNRFDADATALTKCLDEAEELRAAPKARSRGVGWLAAAAVVLVGAVAGAAWFWSHPGAEVAVAPKPVASAPPFEPPAAAKTEAAAKPSPPPVATPTVSPPSEKATPVASKAVASPTPDVKATSPSPTSTAAIVVASPSPSASSPSPSPTAMIDPSLKPLSSGTPIGDPVAAPTASPPAIKSDPSRATIRDDAVPAPTPSPSPRQTSVAETKAPTPSPSDAAPATATSASSRAKAGSPSPTPTASPSPVPTTEADAKAAAPSPSDTASGTLSLVTKDASTPTSTLSPGQSSVAEAKVAPSAGDADAKTTAPEPTPSQTSASKSDELPDLGAMFKALGKTAAEAESQLQRAGCYDGVQRNFDSPEVNAAVENYARYAGLSARPAVGPWDELFASLAAVKGRICPLICPAGSVVANDRCIRRPIAILHTVTPHPPVVFHTEAAHAHPHPAHHSSGSNCFDFNGEHICQ